MDKKAFSLLEYFSHMTQNGEYVVLNKRKILETIQDLSGVSLEELDQLIRYLETKKLITIRLMDTENVVLKMTNEGDAFVQLDSKERKNNVIKAQLGMGFSNKIYRRVFWGAFTGAFFGGLIVTAIAFYLFKYIY